MAYPELGVIVQRILEYTDVDAGPTTWTLEEVDVASLVAESAASAGSVAQSRGVRLEVRCASDLPSLYGSHEKLATASQKAGSMLYQQSQASGPAGGEQPGPGATGGGAQQGAAGGTEDVVDAEIVDEDDKK